MATKAGSAAGKIIGGFVLFLASFGLLFWNEGRSVQTYRSLKEGQGLVQTIPSDKVDVQYDQKLVHVQGQATTTATITDTDTNIVFSDTIKVRRKVEMYQWEESSSTKTVKQPDGTEKEVTEYAYKKVWSDRLIDSSRFNQTEGHTNPGSLYPESTSLTADPVTLGAFTLSESLIDQMRGYTAYSVNEGVVATLPDMWSGRAIVSSNSIYIGDLGMANPSSPMIGDVRISYEVITPAPVSVISQQAGNTFQAYQTKAGDRLNFLKDGMHSSQAMFQQRMDENVMMTWLLRILGLVMMYAGLMGLIGWLTGFFNKIPFLGSLLSGSISLVMFLVSFALSLITVAIAWLFYRPLLSVILFAVAGGAIYALRYLKNKKQEKNGSVSTHSSTKNDNHKEENKTEIHEAK